MKTAGDILSNLFDDRFIKKACGYSKFFDSWTDITAKNGIASAADHSRIKDLDNGLLLIEMDHPGWKQILQTKQSKLLNDFRKRFPELDITGISLILGNGKPEISDHQLKQPSVKHETANVEILTPTKTYKEKKLKGIEAIKDDEFRKSLIQLGKTIAEREKR